MAARHVDGDRSRTLGEREPLLLAFEGDHGRGSPRECGLDDGEADGAGADDADGLPGPDVAEGGRVPPGREDVAREERHLVLHPVRDAEEVHVGVRHAEELRLRAAEGAAERARA